MKVFVVSQEGKPLMPTRPRRARLWLKARRARVVRLEPFTIQLRFVTGEYKQTVAIGVDTGSKHGGIAATANGEVVWQAEIALRDEITQKMRRRRQYRRTRRARTTRYRQPRWHNRRRKMGWLPPSVRSKAEATVKAVRFATSFLPVSRVQVEMASFDTQRMQNLAITGLEYQQGTLLGYAVREYVLEQWKRTCAYCHATDRPLQIEHLVPKSRGGSDRVANLTLACASCNQRKGNQTAEEFGFPALQAAGGIPLRDAAQVSALKTTVREQLALLLGREQVGERFGFETNYQRIQVLGLPKSHAHDAVAIACAIGEVVRPLREVSSLRCVPRGQYQRFNGPHSTHPCWLPRLVRGFTLYERVQVQGQKGYIGGRREKGSFVIKDGATGKKIVEVTPRKLIRVARSTQGWVITPHHIWPQIRKEAGASSPS